MKIKDLIRELEKIPEDKKDIQLGILHDSSGTDFAILYLDLELIDDPENPEAYIIIG